MEVLPIQDAMQGKITAALAGCPLFRAHKPEHLPQVVKLSELRSYSADEPIIRQGEASDALRESEQAISEANRELRELSRQSRVSGAKLGALRKSSQETAARLRAQQELLGRMLRRQYLQGEPDALRLVLARENPNDMARQLHYLAHLARARARLVDGLRTNLAELDR